MRPQLLLAAIFGLVLSSCFSPGDGQAPPLETLYFPTGLALDAPAPDQATPDVPKRAKHLYVASSDFDLQYRSSALAAYDLDNLSDVIPRSCNTHHDCDGTGGGGSGADGDAGAGGAGGDVFCDNEGPDPSYFCVSSETSPDPCGAFGVHSEADKLLYPGRCNYIDPNHPQKEGAAPLVTSKVGIGAFATDVIFRQNPDAGAKYPSRLFLPVRGDATLHWIDLDADGNLECGQDETDDHSCDDAHRAGNSVFDDTNQLRLPAEPFGVDATSDGKYVAVTNQTTGSVSLFSNSWAPGDVNAARLEYILSGLPSAPVAIAAVPSLVAESSPGFLVAYSNAAQVDLIRVHSDVDNDAETTVSSAARRYVLAAAGTAAIGANSLGFDSRGLVIDSTGWQLCNASCALSDTECSAACMQTASQPSVYIANRAPASLLVGGMTPDAAFAAGSSELPAFFDSVPLTTGPSRVVLGRVRVAGPGGAVALEQRVFVVCFDSRRIYIYDPKRRVIDAIIATGRGPYAFAVDEGRGLGYLAHFTDSYLGVISLDQRFPQTYASIIASIGNPMPPRASK